VCGRSGFFLSFLDFSFGIVMDGLDLELLPRYGMRICGAN